jgi:hypothetical protein
MEKSSFEENQALELECTKKIWDALQEYGDKKGFHTVVTTAYPLITCLYHFIRKHYPDTYKEKSEGYIKIVQDTFTNWSKQEYPSDYKFPGS